MRKEWCELWFEFPYRLKCGVSPWWSFFGFLRLQNQRDAADNIKWLLIQILDLYSLLGLILILVWGTNSSKARVHFAASWDWKPKPRILVSSEMLRGTIAWYQARGFILKLKSTEFGKFTTGEQKTLQHSADSWIAISVGLSERMQSYQFSERIAILAISSKCASPVLSSSESSLAEDSKAGLQGVQTCPSSDNAQPFARSTK